jgi:hypothetical protein
MRSFRSTGVAYLTGQVTEALKVLSVVTVEGGSKGGVDEGDFDALDLAWPICLWRGVRMAQGGLELLTLVSKGMLVVCAAGKTT